MAMATYAFDFIGEDGSINSVDVGIYASDIDAIRQARFALHSRLTAVALDVWREGRRLIHLTSSDKDIDLGAKVVGEGSDRVTALFPSRPRVTETKTI
ncbi:MAG: hypothetical protein ABIO39_05490 [Caulobacteraceae bacterium]